MILVAGWYLKKSALLRALGQLEPERHIKFFVCIMLSLQGLYG